MHQMLVFASILLPTAQCFHVGLAKSPILRMASPSIRISLSSLKMVEKDDNDAGDVVDRRAVIGGLFALLVTSPLMFPDDANAARSGGRISSGGIRARSSVRMGMGSRSAVPTPTPAPAPSVTIIQAPRTTVIQSVPSYGYSGFGGFGGGYSYAPTYGISPGAFLGLTALELTESVVREQRRAAFLNQQLETQRQLGKDQAEIEALQKQIKEQNDKLTAMQGALNQKQTEVK